MQVHPSNPVDVLQARNQQVTERVHPLEAKIHELEEQTSLEVVSGCVPVILIGTNQMKKILLKKESHHVTVYSPECKISVCKRVAASLEHHANSPSYKQTGEKCM